MGINENEDDVIKVGYKLNLYVHSAKVSCKLIKIIKKKSRLNEDIKDTSKLNIGDEAEVTFNALSALYIELFDKCNALGTFIGMNSNRVILTGKVNDITSL